MKVHLQIFGLGGSMDRSQLRVLLTIGISNFSFLRYGDIATDAWKGFCDFVVCFYEFSYGMSELPIGNERFNKVKCLLIIENLVLF